jgi:hypothetical protein
VAFEIAPDGWYSRFCKTLTHPTLGVMPNMHKAEGLGLAGGVVQEQDFEETLEQTIRTAGSVALMTAAVAHLMTTSTVFESQHWPAARVAFQHEMCHSLLPFNREQAGSGFRGFGDVGA